ncbi:MAG: alkaline phosphatase family protein, partial [Bacteroidota bacterium]|nr:alkaline phosphatase family protein [Bacteroidota bacterium]
MKYTFSACALALISSGCSFQTEILVGESSAHAHPKLVVGITVDQMRADYLTRFGAWDDEASPATFGEGGFRRMVEEGFTCRDHHFGYAPTYTGPGHASIYTGTTPTVHGIVGNDWYDRASGTNVYCASDTSVKGVHGDGVDVEGLVLGASGQMSPHRMLSTTLGDELKMATGGQAKVYGVSMKDRGAILPAGHGADGAFWFYGKDLGHFVSSTYYGDSLPTWLVDLNQSGRAEALMGDGWDRLRNESVYSQCLPDNNPYEGAFKGELRPTFPYDLQALREKNGGYDLLKGTPGGNTLIVDFALAAIDGAELGQDDVTDLLALSFSATDYVGHRVGPHAQETMDMYLRLDLELKRLFDALDEKVGRGQWTAFLSADHGGANVPSHAASMGMPTDYWKPGNLMDEVEMQLQDRWGFTPAGEPWILRHNNDQIFLNHPLIYQRGLDRDAMARFVAQRCATAPGLSKAIAACDAPAMAANDPVVARLVRGHRPGHSGDVFLVPQPGWIDYSRTGTTHGSAFPQDTHVPA